MSIRSLLPACCLWLLAFSAFVWAEENASVDQRLTESAKILSSDDFEGRGVGTDGLNKAADYIAKEFASLGLKTEVFDGSPFQKFTINSQSELGGKDKNRLRVSGPPAEGAKEARVWDLELSKEFNPLAAGGSLTFEAPLVFGGYGITAKDLEYDDYANVDVKGKVVILIRKEPEQTNAKSKFNGTEPSAHAPFNRKIANANEHGAAAVIFVNDGHDLRQRAAAQRKTFTSVVDRIAQLREEFGKKTDPTAEDDTKYRAEIAKLSEQLQQLNKSLSGDNDTILEFNGAGGESTHRKLPVLFASRAKIDIILKAALGKTLDQLEAEIDSDLKPRSAVLADWKASGETSIVTKQIEVKNVVAVLEGEGPRANETVIVGAHYDHLGRGGAGSLAPWTREIHNGADDNASGTATLIEIARQLAARDKKPSRRIVFMAFSGEERGLLGSAFYTRQPKFPLESTVAMVNLDMVGRLKDNRLILYGTGTAKEFDDLVTDLNKKSEFDILRKPGGFGPSDHASFYAKKIPVFHFFTGTHSDYHRPSDDANLLNIEGMRRIAAFSVELVDRLVETEQRPTYVENKKQESVVASGKGANERPYFGSIPDYGDEVDGLKLTGVSAGGPAEMGGLKAGDVIIGLGESKISGIEDFDSALRKFKPGEKVKVKVQREKETVTLEVTLGRARN